MWKPVTSPVRLRQTKHKIQNCFASRENLETLLKPRLRIHAGRADRQQSSLCQQSPLRAQLRSGLAPALPLSISSAAEAAQVNKNPRGQVLCAHDSHDSLDGLRSGRCAAQRLCLEFRVVGPPLTSRGSALCGIQQRTEATEGRTSG